MMQYRWSTVRRYKAPLATAGLDNVITIVEGDAHETIKDLKGPIDMVFLDADKEGYIDYLNKLLPMPAG